VKALFSHSHCIAHRFLGWLHRRTGRVLASLLSFSLLGCASLALAMDDPKTGLSEVGVNAELGKKIDLSLQFTDEDGKAVTLRELMLPKRPLVIVPAYYGCPRLCGLLLTGVSELLNSLELSLGKDFSVATVSFNPRNTAKDATQRAAEFRAKLTKGGIDGGAWHFLVGAPDNINTLMRSLGFRYQPDGEEFSHTAAIFLITPSGELSQYLAGISFDGSVARRALVDASQGSIGTLMDQVFLFCFRYDHLQGKYVWAAVGAQRVGGGLTLSFLVWLIYRLWSRERRQRGASPAT